MLVPSGEVKTGFHGFELDLSSLNHPVPSEELWQQSLSTGERENLGVGTGGIHETRLEDYVVSGLVDFDDITYANHAALLYELAGQVVQHFQGYLSEEETRRVLKVHQRPIAKFVHAKCNNTFGKRPAVAMRPKSVRGFVPGTKV